MNIYKRAKLRNLTNEELYKLLKEHNWNNRDLLSEYEERRNDGRIRKTTVPTDTLEQYFKVIDFVTRPPEKSHVYKLE